MFERIGLVTGMVVLAMTGGALADVKAPPPPPPPSTAAAIPIAARGMFAGQATQVEPVDDHGRRCTLTSRKFLEIEIAEDGIARWSGHHLRELACNGEPPSKQRSCWTSSAAKVTTTRTSKLAFTTTRSVAAKPVVLEKTLTRWKCGAGTLDLPSNLVVEDATCVKVGPADYQLETSADCATVGDDFKDLEAATLELGSGLVLPLTLIRKAPFALTRVSQQVTAPAVVQPIDPAAAPRPTTVPPQMLEQSRISGEKLITPDDLTKLEIQQAGKTKLIGSFKLCLDVTGAVDKITALKSTGFPAYDRKIIAKMTVWKYRPYLIDATPVPVCTAVTFIYSQNNNPPKP